MGEGEPWEVVRGPAGGGEEEEGGGAEHTARGEGGRGARGHTRGWSGRELERARGQREGEGEGLWREEGLQEPPSSRSRPQRETPETAADWLVTAQVVGARETVASLPPLKRFYPPSAGCGRYFARTRTKPLSRSGRKAERAPGARIGRSSTQSARPPNGCCPQAVASAFCFQRATVPARSSSLLTNLCCCMFSQRWRPRKLQRSLWPSQGQLYPGPTPIASRTRPKQQS